MVFKIRKNKALADPPQAKEEEDTKAPEQAPSNAASSEFSLASVGDNPLTDDKFGIANRLVETVAAKSVSQVKRSPDLVALSKQFDAMRKRLRQLITTAKKYHKSMAVLDKNKLQMAKEMSFFAEMSPINSHISSMDEPQSFLSVYQDASDQVSRTNEKYQQEIIDYCIEWEAVVTTRIDKEMADVKKLRETYNRYDGKVDGLRKKVNAQEDKGKSVTDGATDKLKRNDQKLHEASSEFEGAAGPLCFLLEEVVHQGWKDLFPLVQATMKWEVDRSHKEARIFLQLQPGSLEAAFHQENGTSKPDSPKTPKQKPTLPASPKKKAPPQSLGKKKSSTKKIPPMTRKQEDDDGRSASSASVAST